MSIVPVRSPTRPSPAPSSRKSAQQKVRGNHACHSATPRNSSPRGSPAAISFSPSRLSHLLFAQTQVSNSSVPTAAFVSSFSKFLTPGRRARERRTAGGTFFPPAGGGRRGAGECAPSLCAPAGGTRGGQGDNGHKASPKWLSQLERRPGEYSGAQAHRLTATRRLADRRARPSQPAHPAPPTRSPSPAPPRA